MFLDIKNNCRSCLFRYGLTAAAGVAVDYTIFFLLICLTGIREDYANGISLSISIVLNWILAGKTLFASYCISWSKYCLWFFYIAIIVFLYSFLLKTMIDAEVNVVLAKVTLTGLAFFINFTFFKRFILCQNS